MNLFDFNRVPASFRDTAGYVVYKDTQHIYRVINPNFAETWETVTASGFFEESARRKLLPALVESHPLPGSWKTLETPRLPFISYPYEWCFEQLKTAALHTLDVLDTALEHGLILRDATAYNIQFTGCEPIFIDLLSFERHEKARPWQAYGQFCRFFLGPLALMAYRSPLCGRFLRDWIDGLPLDLVSSLLPNKTRFFPALALHLHFHARLQNDFADPRKAAEKIKKIKFSENGVPNLSKALRFAVENLKLPGKMETEWGNYYEDTNYSPQAEEDKKKLVFGLVEKYAANRELAADLGSNTARYSEFLAGSFKTVLALDIDYLAIEKAWRHVCDRKSGNILPLVIDLCNPSPRIGWDNIERESFKDRCHADYLGALAIIHHLVFTGGIPLPLVAEGLSHLVRPGGVAVVEWVPLEDSQVKRLLAARKTIEQIYSFEFFMESFGHFFEFVEQKPIRDSLRSLLVFRKVKA